jgi:hypothetical protein
VAAWPLGLRFFTSGSRFSLATERPRRKSYAHAFFRQVKLPGCELESSLGNLALAL